jgi:hypothetical protein
MSKYRPYRLYNGLTGQKCEARQNPIAASPMHFATTRARVPNFTDKPAHLLAQFMV